MITSFIAWVRLGHSSLRESVHLFPVHTALLCGAHSCGSCGCALDDLL